MKPLTKNRAKELEQSTTRIENIANKLNFSQRLKMCDLLTDIIGFYHHYGLRPGYVKEQWKKISELFGFKPVYYISHSYRNALWAFEWDGEEILVYKDRRGIAIQVQIDFPVKKIMPFLEHLKKVLL